MTAKTGKTILQIQGGVRCWNLPNALKQKIYQELTFLNPKYEQVEKNGGYISSTIPKYLNLYKQSHDKDLIWVPRGYMFQLMKWCRVNKYPVSVEDFTLSFPKIDIKFQGKLRDYQEEAATKVIKRYPIGVLEAPTGSGKTITAIAIIARRRQPTLIIVHNKELLYQWKEAIKKFLDYDCGLIGDSKFDIRDITVGIINTVHKNAKMLGTKFGFLILDECHRVSGSTWSSTIKEIKAKYYLGLSATVFRSDGLGKTIFCYIGPKLFKIDKENLYDKGSILKPSIIKIYTGCRLRGFHEFDLQNYVKIMQFVVSDPKRNALVLSQIYDDVKRYNENILVVSDRVAHCNYLAKQLKNQGIKTELLTGRVSKKERKNIVTRIKKGRSKVLVATISLIGEGFDSPNLSALFLTTPIKFAGRTIQSIGRILRPAKGKRPRVYDFRDNDIRILLYSGFARDRVYKNEGWE